MCTLRLKPCFLSIVFFCSFSNTIVLIEYTPHWNNTTISLNTTILCIFRMRILKCSFLPALNCKQKDSSTIFLLNFGLCLICRTFLAIHLNSDSPNSQHASALSVSNYLLEKSSLLFHIVWKTRPWFSANNPNGPNLATNLGKCYLKDFQRHSWLQPGYQFQDLLAVVEGGESCPVCWASSSGGCPPNYPK